MGCAWNWYGKFRGMEFDGAKLALICDGCVLTMLRDDKPDIPFPAMWDFPGGGREGEETPEECVLRELKEEFGLRLSLDCLTYRLQRPGILEKQTHIWFFGTVLDGFSQMKIEFGDEGQMWEMMPVETYLDHPDAIPHLCDGLRKFLVHLKGK